MPSHANKLSAKAVVTTPRNTCVTKHTPVMRKTWKTDTLTFAVQPAVFPAMQPANKDVEESIRFFFPPEDDLEELSIARVLDLDFVWSNSGVSEWKELEGTE